MTHLPWWNHLVVMSKMRTHNLANNRQTITPHPVMKNSLTIEAHFHSTKTPLKNQNGINQMKNHPKITNDFFSPLHHFKKSFHSTIQQNPHYFTYFVQFSTKRFFKTTQILFSFIKSWFHKTIPDTLYYIDIQQQLLLNPACHTSTCYKSTLLNCHYSECHICQLNLPGAPSRANQNTASLVRFSIFLKFYSRILVLGLHAPGQKHFLSVIFTVLLLHKSYRNDLPPTSYQIKASVISTPRSAIYKIESPGLLKIKY